MHGGWRVGRWLGALGAALLVLLALAAPAQAASEACTRCHREQPRFAMFHDPARLGCVRCHGGDGPALDKAAAHRGLEAYPGRTATIERTCGQAGCHAALLPALRHSIMNSLDGMIELTRDVLGAAPQAGRGLPLAERLAEHGVDGYLRKLCVGCHLGNERGHHGQDLLQRGGGCSACHLQVHEPATAHPLPAPPAGMGESGPARDGGATLPPAPGEVRTGIHPSLTVAIPNQRCFGCHSRSARIALNYVGLAEVEAAGPGASRLPDGRPVVQRTPDLHSEAGLSCIDCHTATGVMGTGEPVRRQREQLDIQCEDCHAPRPVEKPVAELTRREFMYPLLYGWANPDLVRGRLVATQRRGTPLWHVRREDGKRILRKKVFGTEVAIPLTRPGRHHGLKGHERLTCSACHDTWAPQCDGCHIAYDPAGRQWDHLRREETPGRWVERRWSVRAGPPALGVTAEGRIAPFVPGMNLVAELPDRAAPLRRVRYARTTPHTTRRAGRSCVSCHRSPQALGIITGQAAAPWDPKLRLPIGWVAADAAEPAPGLHWGDRSLNRAERRRVQRVGECLECHQGPSRIYDDFPAARAAIAGQRPHPKPGTTAPAP